MSFVLWIFSHYADSETSWRVVWPGLPPGQVNHYAHEKKFIHIAPISCLSQRIRLTYSIDSSESSCHLSSTGSGEYQAHILLSTYPFGSNLGLFLYRAEDTKRLSAFISSTRVAYFLHSFSQIPQSYSLFVSLSHNPLSGCSISWIADAKDGFPPCSCVLNGFSHHNITNHATNFCFSAEDTSRYLR